LKRFEQNFRETGLTRESSQTGSAGAGGMQNPGNDENSLAVTIPLRAAFIRSSRWLKRVKTGAKPATHKIRRISPAAVIRQAREKAWFTV